MPQEIQNRASDTFGIDLGFVRIHTDDSAAMAAQQLSANAFTTGHDVYFARGAYEPRDRSGLHTLGHELAHVVQQQGGLRKQHLGATNERYEREADSAGQAFAIRAGAQVPTVSLSASAGHGLTRDTEVPIQLEKKQGAPVTPEDGDELEPETRVRTSFNTRQTVQFDPADISGVGQIVQDYNDDNLDDASQNNRVAADKAPGVERHGIINVNHGTRILREYYDNNISIQNLIVSSHGVYDTNEFWVGNEPILEADIDKLRPWRPLLNTDTTVFFTGCNIGGGRDETRGKRVTEALARTLGTEVYTNRSWSVSAPNIFERRAKSWYEVPDLWAAAAVEDETNAYKFMGQWLHAIPKEVFEEAYRSGLGKHYADMAGWDPNTMSFDDVLEVTNSPIFHESGEFTISPERLPWIANDIADFNEYWKKYEASQEPSFVEKTLEAMTEAMAE